MNRPSRTRIVISAVSRLATCALLGVALCPAQQITGSITGTVTDPTGSAISTAATKLTNTGTGLVQSAVTDEEGNFRFLLLQPGTYSLLVSAPGFKSLLRDGLIVEVDRSLGVPVTLQVGQVSDPIEVKGGS